MQPGIEDALGNRPASRDAVATFIYPQKGGIVYPRSSRSSSPKTPPKVSGWPFMGIMKPVLPTRYNLSQSEYSSDSVGVSITEKYLEGQDSYTGLTPLYHYFPISGIWFRWIWHFLVQRCVPPDNLRCRSRHRGYKAYGGKRPNGCVLNRWK